MASAKLANSTVNQSHADTQQMNHPGASPRPSNACSHKSVVRMAPTYTTNMTGFRTWRCTVSLANESTIARRMIAPSKSERAIRTSLHRDEGEMLDDRPQR